MSSRSSLGWLAACLGVLLALPAAAQKPDPDTIPLRLAQVGDSAELVAALRHLPPLPAGVAAVFSVEYDSTGARESVRALFQVPAPFDSVVSDVLLDHTVLQLAGHSGSYTYLQVHTGDSAAIGVYRVRKETPPRPTNVTAFQRGLERFAESQAARLPNRPFAVTLRMRVGADGVPETVHLLTSLQDAEANAALLELAHTLRFEPGKLDGHPVSVWVSVPVTIEPASGSQVRSRYFD